MSDQEIIARITALEKKIKTLEANSNDSRDNNNKITKLLAALLNTTAYKFISQRKEDEDLCVWK